MTFRASVLTLYPDMFPGPLGASLAGRALEEGIWSLEARNIRDFATDKHRSVDDTPAGGGAGMVLRPDVLAAATTSGRSTIPAPPPAGVSSTLRCLSVAKSRMFRVSSDQIPSSSARPAKLAPSGPGNMSG